MPARWTRSPRLGRRTGLLSRRSFLAGSAVSLGALGLAGCATPDGSEASPRRGSSTGRCPMRNSRSRRPDVSKINPKYYRRTVRYDTRRSARHDYRRPRQLLRLPRRGRRIRHSLWCQCRSAPGSCGAVTLMIGRKSEWATWTPPKEMIQRQPEAAKYARGMPGGLDNPLGARTLHLYQNGIITRCTRSTRPRDPGVDRLRRCKRLCRPPESGHDRPIRTNAGQNEGGRPARVATAWSRQRPCGQRKDQARSRRPCDCARGSRGRSPIGRLTA